MIPDESLLTAYLDGELDPQGRRRLESLLAADLRLVASLRDLQAVRDRISELSRPVPPDLTPEVMRRLRIQTRRVHPWKPGRRSLF